MGPRQDELDDEIRGHLALSIKERIEPGGGSRRRASRRAERVRQRHAHARFNEARLASSLVRCDRSART